MARKSLKAKEPVRLRFKQLANGNKSIYLDVYSNGKREYDFLKLYIIPERTPADRLQNEQTMRAANAIKSQRIIELTNGAAGIASKQGSKILLTDWIMDYPRTQAQKSITLRRQDAVLAKAVQNFAGNKVRLSDVDRDFCLDFIDFLTTKYKGRKNGITDASAHLYYARLVCALNAAVRQGLITHNPNEQITTSEKIKAPDAQRCYLTQEELQMLMSVEPKTRNEEIVKRVFLFSCFCGLRISDILGLTWNDIKESNGQKRIEIVMQKTQEPLYIPLSQQALAYLPERANATGNDRVFGDLFANNCINRHLRRLTASAGINKHVTFHTARHTFATLLLTKGADLYTTSKLLGHTQISTTQIYAKIVDEKKREAVSLLDNIL